MNKFKKEYLKMRNDGRYDLNFFYHYYLSKGGKLTDPNEFTEYFMHTHTEQQVHPAAPPMRIRTGDTDRNAILNYLDGVFELTVVVDKGGNFIKAIA